MNDQEVVRGALAAQRKVLRNASRAERSAEAQRAEIVWRLEQLRTEDPVLYDAMMIVLRRMVDK
jgi:hypothetical protein